MIVSGEVGEPIGASAPGIVTNIEETAQTGTTVTMDMGNGYSAVYGQLADVPLPSEIMSIPVKPSASWLSRQSISASKDRIFILR